MRKRKLALALLSALAAGALVASPASAGDGAVFRTPGEAAYCTFALTYPPLQVVCWTPNDGFTVQMTMSGRPHKYYEPWNRGHLENSAPVLRFGQEKRLGSVVCRSRSKGLTCTNRRGHGWYLGRYVGYRLF